MIEFDRSAFYSFNLNLKISSLVKLIESYIIQKKIRDDFNILDISSLDYLRKNSIIFIKNDITEKIIQNNIIIITDNLKIYEKLDISNILLINKYDEVYQTILDAMFVHEDNIQYKDEFDLIDGSYISKESKIDKSTKIGKNCLIGKGVKIGENCIIKNNVVIKNSIISDNVVISDNTVVGGTGFGFNLNKMGAQNLSPQIGIVQIEKNVHIGSSCTIDRGKIDHTFIGENSMIDNLVHIAHNVKLGKNTCIAAQTGISGSTIIGDNNIIGGQSGFAGHIKIGNNVIIAAKSGITKNIKDNSVVAGFPALDIKEWKKSIIKLKKL